MIPSELLLIAGRQHGIVTVADLRSVDLSARRTRFLVDRRFLVPTLSGAFVAPGWPRTSRQAVAAAALGLGCVASHTTSAAMHGVGAWHLGGPIHLLVRRGGRGNRPVPGTIIHTTTNLPNDDVVIVDGIACTSVARTLMLLANGAWDEEVVTTAVEAAIRDGKASDDWLWWRLERLRCRGRSGVSMLERILLRRAGGAPTESWLERAFLALLGAHGLPLPSCQQRIDDHGAFVARVDFIYEDLRLVIEVNGHEHHASRDQLAADAERRARLVLAGFTVLDFTYDQIVRDPAAVARIVRAALAQFAAHR